MRIVHGRSDLGKFGEQTARMQVHPATRVSPSACRESIPDAVYAATYIGCSVIIPAVRPEAALSGEPGAPR
jgi:hypothetical protein